MGGVEGRDSLSRTVKGAVPVGGDQPEEGPPSDHLWRYHPFRR